MQNISGFGLSAQVVASSTFPAGFVVTEFADDADPLDTPDLEIGESAMGLNGDMVVWSRPQGIEISLNVIPNSAGDNNLDVLENANRVAKGKIGARDVIQIVISYPNGRKATLSSGIMVSGPITPSVASAGRMKTRMYRFRFEQITKTTTPAA